MEEAMKKCVECRSTDLAHSKEQLPFNEVALVEGTLHRCNSCGATYHDFSRVEELSREVAHIIARQEERLLPEQIRFLRKYLGYSGKDFADFLAVAPETVSRWESRQSPRVMQLSTEKLIRLMAFTETPLTAYGLDKIRSQTGEASKPLLRERAGHWHLVVGGGEHKVAL
jgi:putative zinc finger/helix-turn-helix YgiT family protein